VAKSIPVSVNNYMLTTICSQAIDLISCVVWNGNAGGKGLSIFIRKPYVMMAIDGAKNRGQVSERSV